MELILIARVLRRWWFLILIPPVVVAVLVLPGWLRTQSQAGGFGVTIRYSAAQVLDAIPNRDGDFQDVWLASELTVNALTDWVRTSSFLDEIEGELTADGLTFNRGALGVAADNRRSVGQLTLGYPVADELEVITQAAIDVLKTRAQVYFPQLGQQPAQVTILDTPVVAATPPALADRYNAFVRIGLALMVGLGLAGLAAYFDPFLHRRDDLTALGLRVVGSVPKR
jgi:capsular polysaccharide biosynthesis protein